MSAITPSVTPLSAALPSRAEIEDFLFAEAALLDAWQLDAWLDLFAKGARYEVPPAGASDDVDPANTLFYIADDWGRLQHRIRRLKKEGAHSEFPRSKGVRVISNVRVIGRSDLGVEVRSVFVTYRTKGEHTDRFMGHHIHILEDKPTGMRIARKRTMLDIVNLRPQGRISIIL